MYKILFKWQYGIMPLSSVIKPGANGYIGKQLFVGAKAKARHHRLKNFRCQMRADFRSFSKFESLNCQTTQPPIALSTN
jgi:hypothetical protein